METIDILGFTFPRHPPMRGGARDAIGRLRGVVVSLEFSRSQLTPGERAVHLALCRVEAQVRALLRDATAAVDISDTEPLWVNDGSSPTAPKRSGGPVPLS